MRGFIVPRRTRMESENDDRKTENENTSESQETTAQSPRIKLRDLRPEKDPIGAGDNAGSSGQ